MSKKIHFDCDEWYPWYQACDCDNDMCYSLVHEWEMTVEEWEEYQQFKKDVRKWQMFFAERVRDE